MKEKQIIFSDLLLFLCGIYSVFNLSIDTDLWVATVAACDLTESVEGLRIYIIETVSCQP